MKIIYDLSSCIWTCLLARIDKEGLDVNFEGKVVHVNSAGYGYEGVINAIVAVLNEWNCSPIDLVLVQEGFSSKEPRLLINKNYKSGRGKRPTEAYEAFQQCRDKVTAVFKQLGTLVISQDRVEADDVVAWFAANTKEDVVVVSNDGDLAVLSGENKHGARIITRIGGKVDHNPYGDFPHKHISLMKAMVGDSSDSITGIKGFGPKAWDDFAAEFGVAGMVEMERLGNLYCLDELESEAASSKIIKRLWEGRFEFLNSYRLACLHPEWVNTLENQIQWMPGLIHGKVNDERLKKWSSQTRLITAETWEAFVPWALAKIRERDWLALDIETSTGDESDDWLLAQDDPDGVDVIGSELSGMSLTFGSNMQYTVYIPVDHADTANVSKDLLQVFLEQVFATGVELVIHHTGFEGTVMFHEFGSHWKDNGYEGLLPNWLDTKFEASYVDENSSLGLKKLSKKWFNYDQVEYNAVTTIDHPEGAAVGGQFIGQIKHCLSEAVYSKPDDTGQIVLLQPASFEMRNRHKYKMRQLSAKHVFSYAADDTICTASFHSFAKTFMQLEGTYELYREVEIDASYLHCQSFIHGTRIDLPKLAELGKEDGATFAANWAILRDYLIQQGWAGTVTPVYTEFSPSAVKETFQIVAGEALKTGVRLPARLLEEIAGEPLLHGAWDLAINSGDFTVLNQLVASRYRNEPEFNAGSPVQMKHLMYDVMGCEVKVYNKVTDAARAKGEKQGTPKTDNLAIAYALQGAPDDVAEALKAIRLMKMVETRKDLFYEPYPYFVHWKTGRVHSSHNQCATNTRRASSSKPNIQQVSKNEKVEGFIPKIREAFIPHKTGAVIVSMDFMAQELRVIGDYSQDPAMLACFIGDSLKDMHALTGLGIYNSRADVPISYDEFVSILGDKYNPLYGTIKKARALGKATNFTTEFGAMKAKLSQTLMVTEEEAQMFIDAKEAAFSVVLDWKQVVIEEAKRCGTVITKLGGVRHLVPALTSGDKYKASKAERQAVNFKIQSSSAEMTKLAEGRMWRARLEQRFDCEIIGPIHDEVVASVMLEDLYEFLPAMHKCMQQPYADMTVPVLSSISFGKSFGPAHQIEIGNDPSREAIERGIEELMGETV